MKKTVIARPTSKAAFPETDLWLDLATLVDVELSSEDPTHPFEACLSLDGLGWRASVPGPQVIRLLFRQPQNIRRVHLEFSEPAMERSQELLVIAHFCGGTSTEVIRQQWSFSPSGSTSEVEDYMVKLQNLSVLELHIDPGRHDKQCLASLEFIALA